MKVLENDNNVKIQGQPQEVHWMKNDRMGGSIPVWENNSQEGSFGFGDLVDMVNPLQHIPLVNLAYREISGDGIKPFAKIMGGGIFGGPMGVASGLVDAVVTEETGKDMAGNALSLVQNEFMPSQENKSSEDFSVALLKQESLLMPEKKSAMSAATQSYERIAFVDDRTAGSIVVYA